MFCLRLARRWRTPGGCHSSAQSDGQALTEFHVGLGRKSDGRRFKRRAAPTTLTAEGSAQSLSVPKARVGQATGGRKLATVQTLDKLRSRTAGRRQEDSVTEVICPRVSFLPTTLQSPTLHRTPIPCSESRSGGRHSFRSRPLWRDRSFQPQCFRSGPRVSCRQHRLQLPPEQRSEVPVQHQHAQAPDFVSA